MKGVAYLDVDGTLGFRSKEFLEEVEPMFMTNNSHYIMKAWHFDTDNFDLMHNMFSSMRDLRLNGSEVKNLSQCIGFDIQRLKERK